MTNTPRTAAQNLNPAKEPLPTNHKLRKAFLAVAVLLTASFAGAVASAQGSSAKLADRITSAISNNTRAALVGTTSPRAMRSTDLGSIAPDTRFQGITLAFSRTPAQESDLSALILAQQTPGSPLFHQWLTPAQFGARFGVSDNDLATTEAWLQSQGFTIDSVSPSRESITFSGNASSVESAFGTPIHYFRANSDTITHFAPAHDLTIPAALSSVVLGVANLSNYRPQSYAVLKPAFTSSTTGNHFLTPKDVATIYDVNTSYNSGYTGLGQTIVVAGQTAIYPSDVTTFQTAAGTPSNPPNLILVPNTGISTFNTGDQAESDLDVEYSSSIAYKATVDFVYTGNNSNLGVFQSFIYAVQQDLGSIITISYGICEPDLGQFYFNYYENYFKQAAAQGQTVINSSGDSGSTSCYGDGSSTQQNLAVSYPASSQYVLGLGGTEFSAANVAASNSTYFTTANGSDVIGSALSYIPEQTWNDDAAPTSTSKGGLSSGGGGVSIYAPRPSWQSGVAGITAGSFRLVPDISLDSSPNNAGYLYCSSDTGTSGVGFSGSCTNGFRVSTAYANSGGLTVAGGTSFAAPIFAGMLAIINQAKGYNSGQGLIQPTLYGLAANNATYALAFHDITSGGNQCNAGSTICNAAGSGSYAAGTGYDEATGLGSIDLTKLISVWPSSTSNLAAATTTVVPNTVTPALNATDNFTINVASKSGTGATPTGTVGVTDNGNTVTGSPFTLSGGTYVYGYSTATAGVHTLIFTYSGDATYGSSKSTQIINVNNSSFTVAVTSPTITAGSSGTVTVTVTPVNGYTGTVQLYVGGSASTSGGVQIANTCITNAPYSITIPAGTTAPVSASYTVYTSAATCAANGLTAFRAASPKAVVAHHAENLPPAPPVHQRTVPVFPAAGFAGVLGLLALGGFKRRSRLLRSGMALGLVLMLGLSGLCLSGCSSKAPGNTTGTGGTTATGNASPGTYSFTIYANDGVDLAITNGTGTAFTVTIQ
jgi:subtilase family serine protease